MGLLSGGPVRVLIGGRYRRALPYLIIGLFLLGAVVVSGWVVWGDIAQKEGKKGPGEGQESPLPVAFTLQQLGQQGWRVSELAPTKGVSVYIAKVVDANDRVVFELRVDPATGEPISRGAEGEGKAGIAPPPPAPPDEGRLRAKLAEVLGQLALGPGKAVEGGRLVQITLIYQSNPVAEVRLDPNTKTLVPKGERGAGEGEGAKKPEAKKRKAVPGNLVQPLGWLAALVFIISTLYYSWRRGQVALIHHVSPDAKGAAIQGLRRLLRWHEALGLLALGLAVIHIINFWGKLQLSTSWLVFFMMITVILSGAFRQFMGRFGVVRTYWRSFHIPYTLLFLAVLTVHVLIKIGLMGGD